MRIDAEGMVAAYLVNVLQYLPGDITENNTNPGVC